MCDCVDECESLYLLSFRRGTFVPRRILTVTKGLCGAHLYCTMHICSKNDERNHTMMEPNAGLTTV